MDSIRNKPRDESSSISGAQKLTELLKNYNKSESESTKSVDVKTVFSQVYIINLNDKGDQLGQRLNQLGIKNKVINIKVSRKTASVFDFLPDVVREAKKKELESIMVLIDSCHVYQNILDELNAQAQIIQELDWKLMYLGASQNLIRNDKFDWKFYAKTYPGLIEHGVTDEVKYTRHWRFYGQKKEGRFGSRIVDHPRLLNNISAIAVHKSGYDEIAKYKKTSQLIASLSKHIKQKSYAVSPLWFLTDPGRVNKSRNKHNLHLYGLR